MADSTVLAHVLTLLNKRYDYGLDLYLLSIDEGITGYRDDSLEVCHGTSSPGYDAACSAELTDRRSSRISRNTASPSRSSHIMICTAGQWTG